MKEDSNAGRTSRGARTGGTAAQTGRTDNRASRGARAGGTAAQTGRTDDRTSRGARTGGTAAQTGRTDDRTSRGARAGGIFSGWSVLPCRCASGERTEIPLLDSALKAGGGTKGERTGKALLDTAIKDGGGTKGGLTGIAPLNTAIKAGSKMSWKRTGLARSIKAAAAVVFSCAVLAGCVFGNGSDRQSVVRHYVAVILKSPESEFFGSVRAGAEAAAAEYNMEITVEGTQSEEGSEEQNDKILKAVENGAEAIILSSSDFEGTAEAVDYAAGKGARIIVIDSDVDSDRVLTSIGTDNYEAGRMAARAMLEGSSGELNIGVVNFDVNVANGQQREQGFREVAEADPRVKSITTVNVPSASEVSMAGAEKLIEEHPVINAVVALNELTTLGTGQAIEELGVAGETVAVGFDSNAAAVGMLETGVLDALVVQNPYAMGYLGVEAAYRSISGEKLDSRTVTEVMTVTRDNMYDEDRMRMMFFFY